VNLNLLRWIDEIFGPIVARLFFIIGLVVGRSQKLRSPLEYKTVKKVLIIKFFGGGSILLASPAIYGIKKVHPDAHISIITLSENKEICSLLKAIDEIYYLDLKNPFSFFFKYFKLLQEIKKKNYDFIIDLEFVTNFSALTALLISIVSKPCATIGFSSPSKWRNKIYSIAIPFDHSRHITEIFAKLFFHLVEKPFKVDFKIPKKDIISLAELSPLTKELLDEYSEANNIVCVNINAGKICHLRRWPQENYAELIVGLRDRFGTKTVLIGGKEDVSYVEDFIAKIPKKIPKKFLKWKNLFKSWHAWLEKNKLSKLQACLNFILSFKQIDVIIFGACSKIQIKQIINTVNQSTKLYPKNIISNNLQLIDPRQW